METIKRRERDAILQSLQAGLAPRQGLHLIQVGRKDEVQAVLKNLERIEEGGSAFRIVVGRFGCGKSFFLNLVRSLALQKRMVSDFGRTKLAGRGNRRIVEAGLRRARTGRGRGSGISRSRR